MEEDCFIIDMRSLRAPDDFIRLCDCCNDPLTNDDGICIEDCFITSWGLVCKQHLGDLKVLKAYKEGDDLKGEWWF